MGLRAPACWLWGHRAVLGGAVLVACGARGLHGSAVSCGRNLLKKFAAKTRKKFWYEGPSLGSYLAGKPSKSEAFVKAPRKTRREDHVRLWALNGLLHKALADLLCTPEVSPEVCDLSVELSKVSLSPDFSACRVYWRTSLSAEQNARTQAALQRSAPHLRLISCWLWLTLDHQVTETTLRMTPGTLAPGHLLTPRSQLHPRVSAGLTTRLSTGRLRSIGGESGCPAPGPWAGHTPEEGGRPHPDWACNQDLPALTCRGTTRTCPASAAQHAGWGNRQDAALGTGVGGGAEPGVRSRSWQGSTTVAIAGTLPGSVQSATVQVLDLWLENHARCTCACPRSLEEKGLWCGHPFGVISHFPSHCLCLSPAMYTL